MRDRDDMIWWGELWVMLHENRLEEFWQHYSDYLKDRNIISNVRIMLYEAIQKTLKILEENG